MHLLDLLKLAIERKASDLHLIAGISPILRIYGEIIVMDQPPLPSEEIKQMLYEVLPKGQIAQFENDLELCYSLKIPDVGYFRIGIYHELGTVGAAIRIGTNFVPSLTSLGLPPVVAELTRKATGLILITGPTGSGKTTTMNSMIDLINSERRCKIIMVEDPVEYVHSNKKGIVVQMEVHSDTHSFQHAIVHTLRLDPNVIAIGEMRDLETMSTALTAAETGHLVISTLHTPDAPQTINRIVDVFPATQQNQIRMQLAESLNAIISQKLLSRVDKPGRILATEVLVANNAVRNIIRENKTESLQNVLLTGASEGMQSMDISLRNLYQQGIITYDIARCNSKYPEYLRN